MRYISAQYLITNAGPPLRRGVITTEDDGTIVSVVDSGGNLKEKHSVEFYNGIIIPGFVNCHCHLELSHMKLSVTPGCGLGAFIEQVRINRENKNDILSCAESADNEMFNGGVVLCADVCNTSLTFSFKNLSRVNYVNLLEVFGIDPEKADRRLNEILKIAAIAENSGLDYHLVPHSLYSMSVTLLRLLRAKCEMNKISSIHFLESPGEKAFLENHNGPIFASYLKSGLIPSTLETVSGHADGILNEITHSGNLILVHNTYSDREIIRLVNKRRNVFWCLCPNSNIFIEKEIPPLNLFLEEGCEIVIGTDSLASNNKLSILEELKTLQQYFPSLSIEQLVCWATINGAKALGMDDQYGKIEQGKKPGLLLLENVDMINMKMLPDSYITQLIP